MASLEESILAHCQIKSKRAESCVGGGAADCNSRGPAHVASQSLSSFALIFQQSVSALSGSFLLTLLSQCRD